MWKLVIEDDEGKRTVVPLTREDYTIGRQEGNTIRLTERNVSRKHAKLTRRNDGNGARGFALEDLASYNGVYVNGLRVAKEQDLVHGDLVQVGDYRIIMQDDAVVEPPTAVPQGPASFDPKQTVPQGAIVRGSMLMERPNRLVMLAGPTPGAEFSLDTDRLTVGRAEEATISINHNSVSRLHCEIHALGEARFEIVDKGSSNGVRLNGADLRRGIIEAGDIIELGDVRFKFVGAGQIFIPGTGDSQQLQAIGDRLPTAEPRRSGSVVPFMVFGAIVAAGAIGLWAFMRHQRSQEQPIPSATQVLPDPLDAERKALTEAKQLCVEQGDCEAAHAKLQPITSAVLRESSDFRDVENRWADAVIKSAEREPDLAQKRLLYRSVATTMTVDANTRDLASARLVSLDEPPVSPTQLPVATKDGGIAVPPPKQDGGAVAVRPPPRPTTTTEPTGTATAPPHTATVAATTTAKPPARSEAERAREAMLAGRLGEARSILEAKVFSGRGNADEINLLRAICKGPPRDQPCLDALKKYQ